MEKIQDRPEAPHVHDDIVRGFQGPSTKKQKLGIEQEQEENYEDQDQDQDNDYIEDPYDFVAGSNLTRSRRGKLSCYSSKHVRIAMSQRKKLQ
jgi:hypothetical protein